MIEKMEFKVVPVRSTETGVLAGYTLLARKAGRGRYDIRVADGDQMYLVKTLGEVHQKRRELSGSPRIVVNQVWCDADPRMTRWIRIIKTEPDGVVYCTCTQEGTGFGRHLRAKYDAFQLDGQDVVRGFTLSTRGGGGEACGSLLTAAIWSGGADGVATLSYLTWLAGGGAGISDFVVGRAGGSSRGLV